jgi:hypothetical protein
MAVPTGMKGTTGKHGPTWPVTVGVYSALFLFGAVQGLVGSFQYSRAAGSVPVAALVCCAVILATCLLGAWATRSVSGAVLVSNGSVIITSTTAGKWYLYGGTLCVAAGVVASFVGTARWARRNQ